MNSQVGSFGGKTPGRYFKGQNGRSSDKAQLQRVYDKTK